MAKLKNVQDLRSIRPYRYFSEEFKKQKVKELEQNLCTVAEVSQQYQVSATAIYKWIYKYSMHMKKGIRQVVEAESDTKKLLLLQERIKELERVVGQKQLHIDFMEKLVELASTELEVDIKKKYGSKPSPGSLATESGTAGK